MRRNIIISTLSGLFIGTGLAAGILVGATLAKDPASADTTPAPATCAIMCEVSTGGSASVGQVGTDLDMPATGGATVGAVAP